MNFSNHQIDQSPNHEVIKPKLIRITTSPLSLRSLLSNQMKYMKENGFDVIMVSSQGREWPDLLANEGCEHRIVPMTRAITPFKDLASLWKLYRLFKKEKPDIVHSHTPKAGLLAMLAAKFAGVKIRIHTIAGLRFMTSRGMTRRVLVAMEKLTASSANYVWPNSQSLLGYIQKTRLVRENKLAVVGKGSSNGVDLGRYTVENLNPEILEKTKRSFNYDNNYFYLLTMGRIVKDKGIEELVTAFQHLYQRNDQLRLILLGSFEDRLDPVSDNVREILSTHPGIIHVEWSDSAEYFMHLADIMVHASYREGFPSTLLQAGAINCPIVCSAIEGSVDIVTHNETGLLFEARNAGELQEKLAYAMANMDEMKIMALKLRQKVEMNFSQQYLHGEIRKKYFDCLTEREELSSRT